MYKILVFLIVIISLPSILNLVFKRLAKRKKKKINDLKRTKNNSRKETE